MKTSEKKNAKILKKCKIKNEDQNKNGDFY